MSRSLSYRFGVDASINIAETMRDEVEAILENSEPEIRDATKMTVSELLENALKYGNIIKSVYIDFKFNWGDDEIIVAVTNGVASKNDIENVKLVIDQIQSGTDTEELYVKRLKELMDSRAIKSESRLGLLRIAYEGQFKLYYSVSNKILKITAVRSL